MFSKTGVQKCVLVTLVDLEKCRKMSIWLQKIGFDRGGKEDSKICRPRPPGAATPPHGTAATLESRGVPSRVREVAAVAAFFQSWAEVVVQARLVRLFFPSVSLALSSAQRFCIAGS